MSSIFSNSVGRKLLMSLAGLFLVTFLLVHLGINLLLLLESNEPFNRAAHFMGTNPAIKVFEVVLFGGFLLHIIMSIVLTIQNMRARPVGYAKTHNSQTSFFSKYMVHTAVIVLVFLVIHIMNFYIKAKFGDIAEVHYDGKPYHDLASVVISGFQMPVLDIFYIISFIILAFHLNHGFQSAFQTLGANHEVYTPVIKKIGVAYCILIAVGFSIIPIFVYFFK